jgi:predicted short-subunit dehydrogenase-like oxidoreductase (DUF2520 family)
VKTINVIGCGHVGRTLARLWTERQVFQVEGILNRSPESSRRAAEFVGAGRVVDDYSQLERADLVMISASDEAIAACCRRLCRSRILGEGVIVFHLSGSLPSTILDPARAEGALVASAHPVQSFADPEKAAKTFDGTFCAIEGDPGACQVLRDALGRCGAQTFFVDPKSKTIYHAATVLACNYLVALVEVGLRCFEKAGIPRETALELLEPIVRATVDNVFQLGPVHALTGPIARGEVSVVERQCQALGTWDERVRSIYRRLGQIAAELSAAQGKAGADALERINELLNEGEGPS